jgi:Tfp pilus assembly protein PilW
VQPQIYNKSQTGFSLLELIIAMGITLAILSVVSTLLASSMKISVREDTRANSITDAQQALQSMSREIANAGFNLTSNGIVSSHSGANSIRLRANLNAYKRESTSNLVTDMDEDIQYSLSANPDGNGSALLRSDINTQTADVLASRINTLTFAYFNAAGVSTPDQANRVTITLNITLPQVGTPNSPGFQPASNVQLASEVRLRNQRLITY